MKNLHVTPRDDGWAVVKEGSNKASFKTDYQVQAFKKARNFLKEKWW